MRQWLVSVCTSIGMLATMAGTSAQEADPFVGSWRTNIPLSQYDPASMKPAQPSTLVRTVAGSGFTVTASRPGSPPHLEYTFNLDGKDYPLKGTPSADVVVVVRVDAHTQIQLRKKNGVVVSMYRQVVSKDGKTFTSYEIGYKAGESSYHNVLVFDRQ
jgi:hypothetical protein